MAYQKLKQALDNEECHHVEMTRAEARDLVDEVEHEGFMQALDEAQGEADATGKVAYVVLKIVGAPL